MEVITKEASEINWGDVFVAGKVFSRETYYSKTEADLAENNMNWFTQEFQSKLEESLIDLKKQGIKYTPLIYSESVERPHNWKKWLVVGLIFTDKDDLMYFKLRWK